MQDILYIPCEKDNLKNWWEEYIKDKKSYI
jgi:hypothetical protein